jgi:hypothetical protein
MYVDDQKGSAARLCFASPACIRGECVPDEFIHPNVMDHLVHIIYLCEDQWMSRGQLNRHYLDIFPAPDDRPCCRQP